MPSHFSGKSIFFDLTVCLGNRFFEHGFFAKFWLFTTPNRNFEPSGADANQVQKKSNPASPEWTVRQNVEPFGAPEI